LKNAVVSDLRIGFQNFVQQTRPVPCDVVTGAVPQWLRNSALYRTAPGIYDYQVKDSEKQQSIHHWFDGLGTMHQFHIRDDGSVWYHNKLTAEGALADLQTGRQPINFGQPHDPCVTIFGKVAAVINTVFNDKPTAIETNNLNVTLSVLPTSEPNTLAIKSDFNCLQFVDADTFETKKFCTYDTYDKRLDGMISAAHEEYDPLTQTYFNLNIDRMGKHTGVFSLDRDGSVREATINVPAARPSSYIHSFSSTTKYLVVMAWPCFANMLKVLFHHNYAAGLTWQPEKQTLFYVVDRATMTHVATYESTQAFFCFHTINAFDDGDDIVLDLVHHPDSSIINQLNVKTIVGGQGTLDASQVARFRLQAVSMATTTTPFRKVDRPLLPTQGVSVELPTINERFRHSPNYRFVYGASSNRGASMWDSVVKVDMATGATLRWDAGGDGLFPGEPIFVPHPMQDDEDDGVLLSVVLDTHAKRSFLYVLDAKDLAVVAKVAAPVVVPLGFHGMHKTK
ncbi:hypothetical protein As57867_002040, partial [Aphanomyces stellatus]